MGLLNYEQTNGAFPPGGLAAPNGVSYGASWMLRIFPYLELNNIYNQLDLMGTKGVGGSVGWTRASDGNGYNGTLLKNMVFNVLKCPSTPLPDTGTGHLAEYDATVDQEPIMNPCYTGISGGGLPADYPTTRVKGGSTASGYICSGGVLIRYLAIPAAQIYDGLSNTMVVGEQSGWCFDTDGSLKNCRSDCGHGFCMGPSPSDSWDRDFNMTCVISNVGETSFNATGVRGNHLLVV